LVDTRPPSDRCAAVERRGADVVGANLFVGVLSALDGPAAESRNDAITLFSGRVEIRHVQNIAVVQAVLIAVFGIDRIAARFGVLVGVAVDRLELLIGEPNCVGVASSSKFAERVTPRLTARNAARSRTAVAFIRAAVEFPAAGNRREEREAGQSFEHRGIIPWREESPGAQIMRRIGAQLELAAKLALRPGSTIRFFAKIPRPEARLRYVSPVPVPFGDAFTAVTVRSCEGAPSLHQ
jgi:hypothetical protein